MKYFRWDIHKEARLAKGIGYGRFEEDRKKEKFVGYRYIATNHRKVQGISSEHDGQLYIEGEGYYIYQLQDAYCALDGVKEASLWALRDKMLPRASWIWDDELDDRAEIKEITAKEYFKIIANNIKRFKELEPPEGLAITYRNDMCRMINNFMMNLEEHEFLLETTGKGIQPPIRYYILNGAIFIEEEL